MRRRHGRGGLDQGQADRDQRDRVGRRLHHREAAIAKISLPDDQYHFEKKEALPDGFVIRRLSEPERPGVVFADLPGTLAAMEAVCLSLKLK